jgi:hypothetical protein
VLIVGGNQSAGGYEVDNSLRFNDGVVIFIKNTSKCNNTKKDLEFLGKIK